MPSIIAEPNPRRGRFAPSPTGPLHLGSLTAALGSWLMARHVGGEWLLRVEDLDPPRERSGVAKMQIDALAAFGLVPDRPVTWQSTRHELYAAALDNLIERGLAFECRCSRSDLAATTGVHHGCVDRPSGHRPAWRLRIPPIIVGFTDAVRGRYQQQLDEDVGDVVLKRADGYWAYQLAVVVDDAAQKITDVVRGADLIDSTPRQIHLQRCLGYPTPGYAHLPVIREATGAKLAKSTASQPLDVDRPLGALALAYAWLGQDARELAGAGGVEATLRRAQSAFRPESIPASDILLPAE